MSHDRPVDGAPRKEDDQDAWDKWHDELLLNVHRVRSYDTAIDPGSVSANSEDTQTFTVTGLTARDVVKVNKPTKTAGLSILDAFVDSADTLSITFRNYTGSPINAGSETYRIIAGMGGYSSSSNTGL